MDREGENPTFETKSVAGAINRLASYKISKYRENQQ